MIWWPHHCCSITGPKNLSFRKIPSGTVKPIWFTSVTCYFTSMVTISSLIIFIYYFYLLFICLHHMNFKNQLVIWSLIFSTILQDIYYSIISKYKAIFLTKNFVKFPWLLAKLTLLLLFSYCRRWKIKIIRKLGQRVKGSTHSRYDNSNLFIT